MSTTTKLAEFVYALPVSDLQQSGCKSVVLNGHTIALWYIAGDVFAVDNRCPHLGFPLEQGSVKDGILTCHWHHARFDLQSGGTFDQWADDARAFPTEIRNDDVWVDLTRYQDPKVHQRKRLAVGLERDISLVSGKAVLTLLEEGGEAVEPFRIGLDFGTKNRWSGWGQGLTILTCLMNMLDDLDEVDRPRALFHGLSAVSRETIGSAPRFPIRPLPNHETNIPTLKRWFRRFVEVRDAEGAERCIVSAVEAGAAPAEMADMLFASVTDHRYIDIGHPADFTNKAFDALDIAGWENAAQVLTSLVQGYASASRMEESNAWRNPIDLVAILEKTFARFGELPKTTLKEDFSGQWQGHDELVDVIHGDAPQSIADALLDALSNGATVHELAGAVSYAAALRIARFHTSNEFADWDTALHTFTFANAIQEGLLRAPSLELLRGVFDAAMSVYLDRFLNIPPARLPATNGAVESPTDLLAQFPALLNQQQRVNQAAQLIVAYAGAGGEDDRLLAMLGHLLLREDRDFHTIQTVEAAFNQFKQLRGTPAASHVLIAAARYLAAHAPTVRAQGQTYQIAARLHRGEHLFEAA